jgi:transposase-like protein
MENPRGFGTGAGRPPGDWRRDALHLRRLGWGYRRIARHVGVNVSNVYRYLRGLGL